MQSNNPFAQLLDQTNSNKKQVDENQHQVNALLQEVFSFTLNDLYDDSNRMLVSMAPADDIDKGSNDASTTLLTQDNIDDVLLQRLLMLDPDTLRAQQRPLALHSSSSALQPADLETRPFHFLFNCYKRLHQRQLQFNKMGAQSQPPQLFDYCAALLVNMCRSVLSIVESEQVTTSIGPIGSQSSQPERRGPVNSDHSYSAVPIFSDTAFDKCNKSNLSVQLVELIVSEGFGDNTANEQLTSAPQLVEQFFDSFVLLFESDQQTQAFLDCHLALDTANNEQKQQQQCHFLLDNVPGMDTAEIAFFRNMFAVLNSYLLANLEQLQDYSNDYARALSLVRFLTQKSKLAKLVFVCESSGAANGANSGSGTGSVLGRVWQTQTLIGKLLTPHALPIRLSSGQSNSAPALSPAHNYRYFLNSTQLTKRDVELQEASVWQAQTLIRKQLRALFYDHLLVTRRGNNATSATVRAAWLRWLSECLHANKRKQQDWNHYTSLLNNSTASMQVLSTQLNAKYASDGFLLNLLDLALCYALPFCNSSAVSSRLLRKVNWTYCTTTSSTATTSTLASNSERARRHFQLFDNETMLIPAAASASDEAPKCEPAEFNFITEAFHMSSELTRLAYFSLYQRLMRLNQELSKWQQLYQRSYQELVESGSGINDPQTVRVKETYESMTIQFLNLKATLLDPNLVGPLFKFLCTTCLWLTFVGVKAVRPGAAAAAPAGDTQDSIPLELCTVDDLVNGSGECGDLNADTASMLSHVPEYLITNVVDLFVFLGRFKESLLVSLLLNNGNDVDDDDDDSHNTGQPHQAEQQHALDNPYAYLNSFVTMVLVYMGSTSRLFNPHARASLVEAVDYLLPKSHKTSGGIVEAATSQKKQLAYYAFAKHPCASYFSHALLQVFVSIEMTGQSVQFEQKFNYRRPMYELIEFLWNMPHYYEYETSANAEQFVDHLLKQHRRALVKLADDSFRHMDDTEQPLFLKFLNFLINDANYLLFEGLLYLEKIKVAQDKLAQDDYEKLSANAESPPRTLSNAQRAEIEANLNQMIMLAKFHNFMSSKTISTIRMLTDEIKHIFCHDSIVDRIATMLNDFLLHLVGKKQRKQLKVKNFDEVEFKPKEIVSHICDIYLNLGEKDNFCKAVARDGRSYSQDLFPSALEVLEQIHRDAQCVDRFAAIGRRIQAFFVMQQADESLFEDAPDEYVDPIMGHLMSDPVILPSSKKVVDRSTIARHLLSDQTDPFNRSPLTLQDIIPDTSLKAQIVSWRNSKTKSNTS